MKSFVNKSKIIKEVIGGRLKSYGFDCERADAVSVRFKREICGVDRVYDPEDDRVRQYVLVQRSRFDDILTLRVCTDTYGNEVALDMAELKNTDEFPNSIGGWFRYYDEKSYRAVLEILADAFEKHGLSVLGQMSKEDTVIPTKKMADNLYENHRALSDRFKQEFNAEMKIETEKDVDKCFEMIHKAILSVKDEEYSDAQEVLVMTAAFLGEWVCEMLEQEWEFSKHSKTPMTVACGELRYSGCRALSIVVDIWKYGEERLFWFEEFINGFKDRVKENE